MFKHIFMVILKLMVICSIDRTLKFDISSGMCVYCLYLTWLQTMGVFSITWHSSLSSSLTFSHFNLAKLLNQMNPRLTEMFLGNCGLRFIQICLKGEIKQFFFLFFSRTSNRNATIFVQRYCDM